MEWLSNARQEQLPSGTNYGAYPKRFTPSLPFGKYKSQPISQIPTPYLEWLVKQTGTIAKFRNAALDELIERLNGQATER